MIYYNNDKCFLVFGYLVIYLFIFWLVMFYLFIYLFIFLKKTENNILKEKFG